jgi:valine dehydrogenase (NAD+)
MVALAERLWGDASLAGRHVAVAGVGKVGAALAEHLAGEGATMTIADVNPAAVAAVQAALGPAIVATVPPDRIHAVDCDIFSPCALGGGLNPSTIPELRCAAVCGCANNQLATPDDGVRLAEAGVLYGPDYVVNGGGVINIADELTPGGYDHSRAYARVADTVRDTVRRVLDAAAAEDITPALAADRLAEARLAAASVATRS